ncbi:MAG: hypothetical protein ACD_11C00030G0010 [uncultured bacterium]|nr:MAG: hypothetical protein ACD_11C00030G0010 [uncultured bacterium]HBR72017.1 DNA-protecting protein DprA [Candidatus Moranbacteria bacterium]
MKYLNALNKIDGVGSQKLALLMAHFGSAEKIWKADFSELVRTGLSEKLAEKIVVEKNNINPDQEWEKLQKENISLITLNDPDYPRLLKEIHNPPYILYIKGDASLLNSPCLAVVGSRKYTSYGHQVANAFGRDLASAGITVVSGLALGIDAIAHKGALEKNGKTIAVLGNSLDEKSIYPKTNFDLSREILSCGGTLVSEYPIETPPGVGTFPARNRIMAGMTLGTIVVEAALGSGSLITANLALDFNREVFAVPGSIFYPQSEGTHKLIKSGAKLVSSISDILEELKLEKTGKIQAKNSYTPSSKEEENILNILSQEPTHIDRIIKLTKLETSVIGGTLAILEINGAVKNIGGQNYILS